MIYLSFISFMLGRGRGATIKKKKRILTHPDLERHLTFHILILQLFFFFILQLFDAYEGFALCS